MPLSNSTERSKKRKAEIRLLDLEIKESLMNFEKEALRFVVLVEVKNQVVRY